MEKNKVMYKLLAPFLFIMPLTVIAQKHNWKGVAFEVKNDTIKSRLRLCDSSQLRSYYRILNMCIDSDFIIIDSLKAKINFDSQYDYVYVLSNKYQQEYLKYTPCTREHNKRLFLMFLSNGKGSFIKIINENVVLNEYEYQSEPFRKIKTIRNGFIISFYLGTRIRYYYNFYFKADKISNVFLYKSESSNYDIYVSGANKSRDKYFAKGQLTDLRRINIRNFIKYY